VPRTAAPSTALPAARRGASAMRSKHVNLLIALVAFMLFAFSCFCISRMTQTSKQGAGGGDVGTWHLRRALQIERSNCCPTGG
jgi:hypothetical protein